jgi:hypothetical protein
MAFKSSFSHPLKQRFHYLSFPHSSPRTLPAFLRFISETQVVLLFTVIGFSLLCPIERKAVGKADESAHWYMISSRSTKSSAGSTKGGRY